MNNEQLSLQNKAAKLWNRRYGWEMGNIKGDVQCASNEYLSFYLFYTEVETKGEKRYHKVVTDFIGIQIFSYDSNVISDDVFFNISDVQRSFVNEMIGLAQDGNREIIIYNQ
jgi:hypothetical protein